MWEILLFGKNKGGGMDLEELKKGFEERFWDFIIKEDVEFDVETGQYIAELHYVADKTKERSVRIKLKNISRPKWKLIESEKERIEFLKSKGLDPKDYESTEKINAYYIED
jgi:hypothetical protein